MLVPEVDAFAVSDVNLLSATLVHVVPLDVRTFPDVLGATNDGVEVPLPSITLLAVNVASPVPPFATGNVPVTPVVSGNPVQLVKVPELGVPNTGVVSVGDVANTKDPLPVSFVIADAKLALVGVARNVATLVPNPATPVEIGKPVQFVSVPEVGVPNNGVTKVGLVACTPAPVPVDVVTPVPPCNTDKAVVRPVIDVISELAPDLAALNAVLASVAVAEPVPPAVTGIVSPEVPACKSLICAIKVLIALFTLAGEHPSAMLMLLMSVLSAEVAEYSLIFVFAIFYPCLNQMSVLGVVSVQVSVPAVISVHVSEEGDTAVHVSEPADTGVHVSAPGTTGVQPSPCIVPFATIVPLAVICTASEYIALAYALTFAKAFTLALNDCIL